MDCRPNPLTPREYRIACHRVNRAAPVLSRDETISRTNLGKHLRPVPPQGTNAWQGRTRMPRPLILEHSTQFSSEHLPEVLFTQWEIFQALLDRRHIRLGQD